jgi:hypothetical protein
MACGLLDNFWQTNVQLFRMGVEHMAVFLHRITGDCGVKLYLGID